MEWQPIETAPKDGTQIDLWFGKYRITDAFWLSDENVWATEEYDYDEGDNNVFYVKDDCPTHWMRVLPPTALQPDQPQPQNTAGTDE